MEYEVSGVVFVHALRVYLVEVDAAFFEQLGGERACEVDAFGGEKFVVTPEAEFASDTTLPQRGHLPTATRPVGNSTLASATGW